MRWLVDVQVRGGSNGALEQWEQMQVVPWLVKKRQQVVGGGQGGVRAGAGGQSGNLA